MSAQLTPIVPAADCAVASPRAELSVAEEDEMFALLDQHFEGVSRAHFARDLEEKDWTLRIRRGERLMGFSTLALRTTEFEGRRINVVYSGDTIMNPEAWGSPVMSRGWIALVRRAQGARIAEPWYWLLLSSGFRTYRFLPLFWRDFWPRYDAATPVDETRLMQQLARERFGDRYDPRAGIVRFEHPQRLREQLALVPDGKKHNPHVDFFLARNPGHAEGDELVCLTSVGDDNLTAAGQRMLRSPG